MKKANKLISLVLVSCMCLALMAGCGSKTTPAAPVEEKPVANETQPAETTEKVEEAPEEAPAEPTEEDEHIVIGDVVIPTQQEALDQLGLDAVPKQILCTSYNTMMIADAFDIELSGTVTTKRPLPEKYADVPTIGVVGGSNAFDFEKIMALQGDMILGDSTFSDRLEPTFQEQGLKYYLVDGGTYQSMQEAIALLGAAFAKPDVAADIIQHWQDVANEAHEETMDLEHPCVYVSSPYEVFTNKSYVGSMLTILNAVNAADLMGFADTVEPYVPPEIEKLIEVDPDFILIPGGETIPPNIDLYNEMLSSEAYASLSAVKNGKVIPVDFNLFNYLATMESDKALVMLKDIIYGE